MTAARKNGEHTPILCHSDVVTRKMTLSLPAYGGKLFVSAFINVNIL